MIKVYFDDVEINSDSITFLSQSVQPYSQNFKIGNTICREFTLQVLNGAFSSTPNKVTLFEDTVKYATLLVDSVDTENDKFTTFHLTDVMVQFNKDLTYTVNNTVKQILTSICTAHGISLATQSFYMDNFAITWEDNLTERDFISYVAEVNGGYAKINADGNLEIAQYTTTTDNRVQLKNCSSIKVGSYHNFDRVYVELASATKYYPATSQNDTLYLNPENILFTDSGSYTIDGIIQHIHSIINGFAFYNCHIDQCPIDGDIKAGELINVTYDIEDYLVTQANQELITQLGDAIIVNNNTASFPIMATIDWNYSANWTGGYSLDVESTQQEETQIVGTQDKLKRISIKVDRDAGRIDQIVSDASGHTGSFALYLNENDPDTVVSCINASADNIILNTKSLIFGEYPSGKYIEAKTYEEQQTGLSDYLEQYQSGYFKNIYTPTSGVTNRYEIIFTTGNDIDTKQYIFGCEGNSIAQYTLNLYIENKKLKYQYKVTDGKTLYSFTNNILANTKYKYAIDYTTNKAYLYDANGTEIENINLSAGVSVTASNMGKFGLFTKYNVDTNSYGSDYFLGRIYSFVVYNNSVWVHWTRGRLLKKVDTFEISLSIDYRSGSGQPIYSRGESVFGKLKASNPLFKSGLVFEGNGITKFSNEDGFIVNNVNNDVTASVIYAYHDANGNNVDLQTQDMNDADYYGANISVTTTSNLNAALLRCNYVGGTDNSDYAAYIRAKSTSSGGEIFITNYTSNGNNSNQIILNNDNNNGSVQIYAFGSIRLFGNGGLYYNNNLIHS